jgi:copper resistance protein B
MKTTTTLAPLAVGLLLAFNAAAQDHSQHQMPMPQDHSQHQMPAMQDHSQHQAKPKAKTKPKPKAKPVAKPKSKAAQPTAPVDHAAMGHEMPAAEPAAVDHSAMGHDTAQPMPMDHAAMGHTMPRPADQPVTPIPVLTDEDRAAAAPPPNDHPVHDNTIQHFVLLNRLEGFDAADHTGMEWEGQAWIGTDLNKVWLRSEGERAGGHTESADLEVLYGRAFARWWDVVAGVRHDFKPGASQDFAAIGVQGLAPYKFEVEATAYIGQSGQTAARLEAEYETLLTNRLILQPLVEVNFYGKNDERRGIGSGLSTAEAGVRLRYEFTRQFAPYIGVVHERAFGRTADIRREEDEDVNDTRFVAGIRIWF